MTIAGLVLKRDRLMGIGQAITMPLFFASNALYPIQLMPHWLPDRVSRPSRRPDSPMSVQSEQTGDPRVLRVVFALRRPPPTRDQVGVDRQDR